MKEAINSEIALSKSKNKNIPIMDKQKILDNVEMYSAEQLAEFVNKGYVTLEELKDSGQLDFQKRKEIEHILLHADDDAWEKVVQANTIEAAQEYLNNFPEGKHRDDARDLIKDIEDRERGQQQRNEADTAWQNVDKKDIQSLRDFINDYPNSEHVAEANQLIDDIQMRKIMPYNRDTLVEEIKEMDTKTFVNVAAQRQSIIDKIKTYLDEGHIDKNDLVHILRDDHNLLDASIVKQMVDKNLITVEDLLDADIDIEYIRVMLKEVQPVDLGAVANVAPPTKINKIPSTEVYFWGIPDSGKTCVLAAILSVIEDGKIATPSEDKDSQGYGYMTNLANVLRLNNVGPLMEGTPEECFYEMGVDLRVGKDIHPITFVDMAGELMRSMYKYNANPNDPSINTKVLDGMTNLLIGNRSINRKMHFFVIEYGAEDRMYDKTNNNPGTSQRTYLHGAFQYIKDTEIFKKDTDAIFILLTKADKIKGENRKQQALDYIDNNYRALKNMLNHICEDNDINGGSVEIIPFSLGDVCFKDYCRFDPRPAESLLRIILEHSAHKKTGIISGIMEILSR